MKHSKKYIEQRFAVGLAIMLIALLGEAAGQEKQPNILLFIGDDWTWSDNEAYGNPDIITPNIRQLADEGMCFDNMYTSTAMCAPTRQQLYTGIFPVRSGAYPNHSKVYDGVKSLGHHFKDLGYNVAIVGKRHYGPASAFPIDYLGGREHDNGKGKEVDVDKIWSVIRSDKPFFLIVASNQPHTPWNKGNPRLYNEHRINIPEYMVDCPETRRQLINYYAEITYADSLLGACVSVLKTEKKYDETITLFTSEQGYTYPFAKWTCYDLGLKTAFIMRWPEKIKASTRNKAFAQYVDVVPTLLDLVGQDPTAVDVGVADTYADRGFDGISFKELLLDGKQKHREYVYGVQTTRGIFSGSETYPVRSVRSNRYKYIVNLSFTSDFLNVNTNRPKTIYHTWLANAEDTAQLEWLKTYKNRPYEELYDLKNDPFEKDNLAGNRTFRDIKNKLREELEKWMIQQGDLGVISEMKAKERK